MTRRSRLPLFGCTLTAALVLAGSALAQLEPGDRGVSPVDSSSSFEVPNVRVDVSGRTAEQARTAAWREAQRRGWAMLWGKMHGLDPAAAPHLSDGTLDALVAGIEIEEEHVGPTRYIARLGILFDRARTASLLGVSGEQTRSPPTLVIPVEWDGGTPVSLEQRSDWQKAWARFRSGGSPIDYIRPVGTGADPLLLNIAQAERPARGWWRMLLDQYAAADVIVPVVRLTRAWPGGPVSATFEAFHGPDRALIARFDLSVQRSDQLPAMLDEGVRRIDDAYALALREGRLGADPTLLDTPEAPVADEDALATDAPVESADEAALPDATVMAVTLQVDTPDAAALGNTETVLRSVPGLSGLQLSSLALGGVSLYRANYSGDLEVLRTALAARGWRADGDGVVLRLHLAAAATPPPEVTGGAAPSP